MRKGWMAAVASAALGFSAAALAGNKAPPKTSAGGDRDAETMLLSVSSYVSGAEPVFYPPKAVETNLWASRVNMVWTLSEASVDHLTHSSAADALASWALVCPSLGLEPKHDGRTMNACSHSEIAISLRAIVQVGQRHQEKCNQNTGTWTESYLKTDAVDHCAVAALAAEHLISIAGAWRLEQWPTDLVYQQRTIVDRDPRVILGLLVRVWESKSDKVPPAFRDATLFAVADAALALQAVEFWSLALNSSIVDLAQSKLRPDPRDSEEATNAKLEKLVRNTRSQVLLNEDAGKEVEVQPPTETGDYDEYIWKALEEGTKFRTSTCKRFRAAYDVAERNGAPSAVLGLLVLWSQATFLPEDDRPLCHIHDRAMQLGISKVVDAHLSMLPARSRIAALDGATNILLTVFQRMAGQTAVRAQSEFKLYISPLVASSRAFIEWWTKSAGKGPVPLLSGDMLFQGYRLLGRSLEVSREEQNRELHDLLSTMMAAHLIMLRVDLESAGALRRTDQPDQRSAVLFHENPRIRTSEEESHKELSDLPVICEFVKKLDDTDVEVSADVSDHGQTAIGTKELQAFKDEFPNLWREFSTADYCNFITPGGPPLTLRDNELFVPRIAAAVLHLRRQTEVRIQLDREVSGWPPATAASSIERRHPTEAKANGAPINFHSKALMSRHLPALEMVTLDRISSAYRRAPRGKESELELAQVLEENARSLLDHLVEELKIRKPGLPDLVGLLGDRPPCSLGTPTVPQGQVAESVNRRYAIFPEPRPIGNIVAPRDFKGTPHELAWLIAADVLSRDSTPWRHDRCSPWIRTDGSAVGLAVPLPVHPVKPLQTDLQHLDIDRVVAAGGYVFGDRIGSSGTWGETSLKLFVVKTGSEPLIANDPSRNGFVELFQGRPPLRAVPEGAGLELSVHRTTARSTPAGVCTGRRFRTGGTAYVGRTKEVDVCVAMSNGVATRAAADGSKELDWTMKIDVLAGAGTPEPVTVSEVKGVCSFGAAGTTTKGSAAKVDGFACRADESNRFYIAAKLSRSDFEKKIGPGSNLPCIGDIHVRLILDDIEYDVSEGYPLPQYQTTATGCGPPNPRP